jgi:hypothetical protein
LQGSWATVAPFLHDLLDLKSHFRGSAKPTAQRAVQQLIDCYGPISPHGEGREHHFLDRHRDFSPQHIWLIRVRIIDRLNLTDRLGMVVELLG